jgi:hypothetical protein
VTDGEIAVRLSPAEILMSRFKNLSDYKRLKKVYNVESTYHK